MTDTSLPSQPTPPVSHSYVDSYTPPVTTGQTPTPSQVPTPPSTPQSSAADPLAELEKALQEYEARQKQLTAEEKDIAQKTQAVVKDTPGEDPLAELERVLDEYEAKYKQPPTQATADAGTTMTNDEFKAMLKDEPIAAKPVSTPTQPTQTSTGGQAIEEQNIFELLGVMDAEASEKEAFLDELQQALWEDFLDKDVSLLVTADQLKEIQTLRAQTTLPENERQEKLIAKVEKLVPDIEDIMLEKALELKEDMVRERLAGMKEYYAARPAEMAKIQTAEKEIAAGRWKAGAALLNSLTA